MRALLLLLSVTFLLSCKSKKDVPCFQEADVSNCTELFEAIQQNLNNQDKILDLRDCYDQHCK